MFISGSEHTAQGENRGIATSLPYFVQRTVTDTQASEMPLSDMTVTIIKTSSPTADVVTQEQHYDPESNHGDDKPAYEV